MASGRSPAAERPVDSEVMLLSHQPALQVIYDSAPIGLACLSTDCRYLRPRAPPEVGFAPQARQPFRPLNGTCHKPRGGQSERAFVTGPRNQTT
jgi:hypothetical protein